jgi:hypothetical protein
MPDSGWQVIIPQSENDELNSQAFGDLDRGQNLSLKSKIKPP